MTDGNGVARRRTDMERLTKRNCNNFVIPVRGTDAVSILQAIDRLAAIEDILGDEYDLDELAEMVQAKREGRCVVLPCKIFDKIWNVAAHYQFEVTEIDLLPYGNILFRCGNKGTDDYAAFYGDDLGDTFTFKEPQERDNCVVKEAEAALRREQDGQGGRA